MLVLLSYVVKKIDEKKNYHTRYHTYSLTVNTLYFLFFWINCSFQLLYTDYNISFFSFHYVISSLLFVNIPYANYVYFLLTILI